MDERFKKVEDEYFRLKGQLAAGRITQAQFEAVLKDLSFQDSQGRYWNLGPDSGKWYVHVGENWVEADPATASLSMDERSKMPPPRVSAPSPAPMSPSSASSGGLGIVSIGLIVVVLLVLAVGGLLFASSQGIVQISLGSTATPTINAAATSAAQATNTAQAQAQATASAQAQATGTAQAQATLTVQAQAQATATAQAQATSTAQALATSRAQQTASAQATQQALLAYIDALVASARKFYGPNEGQLGTPVEGNLIKTFYTGVTLKNFVVEARFSNPADRTAHKWDYGFGFRRFGQRLSAVGYRFSIDSNSTWLLSLATGKINPDQTAEVKRIGSGTVKNFDVSPTGSNVIRLVINGVTGFFYVNEQFAGTLDISDEQQAGDVWIGSGISGGTIFPGLSTPYKDFVMWSLP